MVKETYEVFKKCFEEFTLDLESYEKLAYRKSTKEILRYKDDKLVAFGLVHHNKINVICTDPEYRNQGFGSSILEAAEKLISEDEQYKDIVLGRSKLLLAAVCNKEEYYARRGVHFFKRRGYTSLGYCEDMCMDLSTFDINKTKYNKDIEGVTFEYYKGSHEDLLAAVAKVDKGWLDCFDYPEAIFVGLRDGKPIAFCNISPDDTTKLTNENTQVGNIGCVGTIPEERKKGIGLHMVALAMEELKKHGTNIANIHYTGVADWYRKLGYETYIYYWFAHKKINR